MIRQRVLQAIEFVLGLPQYARGVVGATDVATEAALADTALRTRMGKRIQVVNDTVEDMCFNIVALYKEFLKDGKGVVVDADRAEEAATLGREQLGFDRDDFFQKYESIAHSPLNNNSQYKLQQLQAFFPMLAGNPNVKQDIIIQELLTLLEMPQAYQPTPPPPPMGMPGMPPGGPTGMPPGTPGAPNLPALGPTTGAVGPVNEGGMPNVAGGDMPPGTEPPVTVPLPGRPAMGKQ
jgi:hypothetical protein